MIQLLDHLNITIFALCEVFSRHENCIMVGPSVIHTANIYVVAVFYKLLHTSIYIYQLGDL